MLVPKRCAFMISVFVAACAPKIGDECTISTDCSQQGDRLCDTNQPGGYCTIFNCEPDTCPEDEGVCVAFNPELDPSCQSYDDAEWARYERTFCLAPCESSDDCRSDYSCVAPSDRGAEIVDDAPIASKVCMANIDYTASDAESVPAICSEESASESIPWTPYNPDQSDDL